jgi:hypothetical protein
VFSGTAPNFLKMSVVMILLLNTNVTGMENEITPSNDGRPRTPVNNKIGVGEIAP